MLVALRTLSDNRFVSRTHPAILKGLRVRLRVIEITQDDRWGSDEELARLIIAGDLVAFDCDEPCLNGWEERAGGAEVDIIESCRADYSTRFCETCKKYEQDDNG